MTKKSLGYVELEWNCPNCNGRNSGRDTICTNCGAPQPENVEFVQPAEEEIIKDAVVLERAKLGPDIHCAFCGTRNPADATHCSQCGAELAEGAERESGEVLGAHRDEPAPDIKCPYCGTMNDAGAYKCRNCAGNLQKPAPEPAAAAPAVQKKSGGMNRWLIIGIAAVFIAACIGLFIFLNQTDEAVGRVNDVSWERQIVILGLAASQKEAWRDEIPPDGEVGVCRDEIRYTTQEQVANSVEVCGTPYTVDTGSGFGEVVQECEYQVYEDRCEYTIMELQPVDQVSLSGSDLNPRWPTVNLENDRQEGERSESYRIVFSVDGELYTYTTNDVEKFEAFEPGSNWRLSINPLGGVVSVEPAD